MGLLALGSPLSWNETKKHADHVRRHGIIQFLNIYHRLKNRQNDILKWGDEVEYILLKFDHENKKVSVNLKGKEVLDLLSRESLQDPRSNLTAWSPEYGSFMVEGTPGYPYGGCMRHFNVIEANMQLRRCKILEFFGDSKTESVVTTVGFPRLGCSGCTSPPVEPSPVGGASCSMFVPDEVINVHPRFSTLTRNICERRGSKVAINIPIFKDEKTPSPFIEKFPEVEGEGAQAAQPDHIYMDAMGFGMTCSSLQATFQACSMDEARLLYDQLAVVTPILLAHSAAQPIFRGYLADVDCRWDVIVNAVDDRTPEERGEEPLKNDKFVIPKSRFESISCYLSPGGREYSDLNPVYDKEIFQQLIDGGVDEQLALHYAHLWIRDPLTLWKEHIYEDDEKNSHHFENIQSTNWQTMRFKPPPPNSSIGWRVEFRPVEVQLTDFENAAYVAFVVLLSRVILSFDLNLLMPLSLVDENMKRAQKRDAVRQETFYFRSSLKKCSSSEVNSGGCAMNGSDNEGCFRQMSVDVILNGKEGEFPGLIPLINSYLGNVDIDIDTRCTISQYLNLIQKRASGELMTTARWMREFVQKHPDYKRDSVVSERICYDLMSTCDRIGKGQEPCPELFGTPTSKTSGKLPKKCQQIQEELEKLEARTALEL